MKLFYPKGQCAVFLALAVACFAVTAAGAALCLWGAPDRLLSGSGLMILGFALGAFFIALYFAVRSRYLLIDGQTVTFPRGVHHITPDGRHIPLTKRTCLYLRDIVRVDGEEYDGDMLITADDTIYYFALADGSAYGISLREYGKDKAAILAALQAAGVPMPKQEENPYDYL